MADGAPGKPIAITGIGMVTSLGKGVAENWRRLTAGESGIHRIERFPTEGLRTTIAGSVDFMDDAPITIPSHSSAMADHAIAEAMENAGWRGRDFPGDLFLAAPPIEHDWESRRYLSARLDCGENSPYSPGRPCTPPPPGLRPYFEDFLNGTLADRMAEKYRVRGSPITLTTACASGATTIQLAVEAIRRGDAPAALAVGTDGSINEETLIRFSLLSALSSKNETPAKASRPFSKNRDGFVMAEGAACLVLEDPEHARARGAAILAYVRGSGEAADTFHRTRSHPNGQAIVRAMKGAIDDAGLSPADIGYINAHGTGTPENDKMEHFGIVNVFGVAGAEKVAVSSNKSMIGHSLTAAGAVESAFTVLTLKHGILPPTINYEVPDPAIRLDVVPNRARRQQVEFALSNSFGFGGQNVSLVFAAAH
jgi:3-oxoacyl-[acyl-carrier-protein] synthase II